MTPDPTAKTRATRVDLAGTYAFRFSGYSMANDVPYYLVGIGRFTLDQEGGLAGSQKSSITQVFGQGASIATAAYVLSGSWTMDDDATEGTAQIQFTSSTQNMTGTFENRVGRPWTILDDFHGRFSSTDGSAARTPG